MDRLSRLLRFEWKIAWRAMLERRDRWQEPAAWGLVILYAFSHYLTFLEGCAHHLQAGDPARADALLAGLFLAWAAWWLYAQGPALPRHPQSLPLGRVDLFALRVSAGIGSVVPLGLAALSASALLAFRNVGPSGGLVPAGLAYFGFCFFSGFALSAWRDAAGARRGAPLLLDGALALLAGIFLAFLFRSGWTPHRMFRLWLMEGAAWRAAGVFAGLTLALAALCLACGRIVRPSAAPSVKLFPFFVTWKGLYRLVPVLLLKDLRLLSRHLEVWLILPFSLQGTAYFLFDRHPHPLALSGAALILLSVVGPVTFNTFGLETRGAMTRYRLLPLGGHALLRSKNTAFLLLVLFLMAPMAVAATVRIGFVPVCTSLLSAGLMANLFATFGNEVSVRYPRRSRPYRFSSYGLEPGLLRMVVVQILCSAPGAILLLLQKRQGGLALLVAAAALAALIVGRRAWVRRQGLLLDQFLGAEGRFSNLAP